MANRVNREHGPHRRPVGVARTVVPSQATGGWARSAVARYASGAEWGILGFTHQRSGLLTRLLQKLAEDLRDRGKLDLSESFIDASFSSAKKGALLSALLAAVKAAKSWRSATAMVFLSPCTWPALRLMKPSSSHPPSSNASSPKLPSA